MNTYLDLPFRGADIMDDKGCLYIYTPFVIGSNSTRTGRSSCRSQVANSTDEEESRSALMAANAFLGPELLKTWESSNTVEVPASTSPIKNSIF